MGLFGKIRETFRDPTRNNICADLQTLGIDAQLAERGRDEEGIDCDAFNSVGVIDIREGPIRWVNVVRRFSGAPTFPTYQIKYGVPDPRLGPDSPEPQIKSVRKKDTPLVGNVVDLHWKGNDFGLGIISRLNNDVSLKHPIMESHDVTISTYVRHGIFREYPEASTWIITTELSEIPSEELWNCYQTIAKHLLAEWPSK